MNSTAHVMLDLSTEEIALILELLESERTRLLVEIRHSEHRAFREQLRQRLALIEGLMKRC